MKTPTAERIIVEATDIFCRAQSSSKSPPKRYRRQLERMLQDYWQLTTGSGRKGKPVKVSGRALYALLHQATQTLP